MQKLLPVTGAALLVLFGFDLFHITKENFAKPDYGEMRRYVVSQLTDEELLEGRRKAERELSNKKTSIERDKREQEQRDAERARECASNPANSLRGHPTCIRGIRTGDNHGALTVEGVFEEMLMYYCQISTSVWQARQKKCLPPYTMKVLGLELRSSS